MIDIERLRRVKRVLSHMGCPDGKSAAMMCAAALNRLGVEAEFDFVQYGHADFENLEARDGDLFVDITPPKARWEDWRGKDVTVLDHHATVKHVVEGLSGIYGEAHESGASLAFDHVLKPVLTMENYDTFDGISDEIPPPLSEWEWFARMCVVRDTWQEGSPDWEESYGVAEYLKFRRSKDLIREAPTFDFVAARTIMKELARKAKSTAALVASGALLDKIQVDGNELNVAVANCPHAGVSDAANFLLRAGCDLAVCYFTGVEDEKPRAVVSMRSSGEFVVNEMAAARGGGGHRRAAGYRLDGDDHSLRTVLTDIKRLVWETRKTSCDFREGAVRATQDEIRSKIRFRKGDA